MWSLRHIEAINGLINPKCPTSPDLKVRRGIVRTRVETVHLSIREQRNWGPVEGGSQAAKLHFLPEATSARHVIHIHAS